MSTATNRIQGMLEALPAFRSGSQQPSAFRSGSQQPSPIRDEEQQDLLQPFHSRAKAADPAPAPQPRTSAPAATNNISRSGSAGAQVLLNQYTQQQPRSGSQMQQQQQQQFQHGRDRGESALTANSSATAAGAAAGGGGGGESQQELVALCHTKPQQVATQLSAWRKHAAQNSEALQMAYAEIAALKEAAARSQPGLDARCILDGIDELRIGRAKCLVPALLCFPEAVEPPPQDGGGSAHHDDDLVTSEVILTVTPQALFLDEVISNNNNNNNTSSSKNGAAEEDQVEPLAEIPLHSIDSVVRVDAESVARRMRNDPHQHQQFNSNSNNRNYSVVVDIITNSGLRISVEFSNDIKELVDDAGGLVERPSAGSHLHPMHHQHRPDSHRASARATALTSSLKLWHPKILDTAEEMRVAQAKKAAQSLLPPQMPAVLTGRTTPKAAQGTAFVKLSSASPTGTKIVAPTTTPAAVSSRLLQPTGARRGQKSYSGLQNSKRSHSAHGAFSPRLPDNRNWTPDELLWAVDDITAGRAEYAYGRSVSTDMVNMVKKSKPFANSAPAALPPGLPQSKRVSTSRGNSATSSSNNIAALHRNSKQHQLTVARAHTPTGLAVVHARHHHHHHHHPRHGAGGEEEEHEDAAAIEEFLASQQPHYDATDPVGNKAVRAQWLRTFGATYNERATVVKSRTLPDGLLEMGSGAAMEHDHWHQDPASDLVGVRRSHNHPKVKSVSSNYGSSQQRSVSDADIILANAMGAADAGIMTQPLPTNINALRRSQQSAQQYVPAEASPIPFRYDDADSSFASKRTAAMTISQQQPAAAHAIRGSPVPTPASSMPPKPMQQQSTPQQQQHQQRAAPVSGIRSFMPVVENRPKPVQQLQPQVAAPAPTAVTVSHPAATLTSAATAAAPKGLPVMPSKATATATPSTATTVAAAPAPKPAAKVSPLSGGGGGGPGGFLAELQAKQKAKEEASASVSPSATATATAAPAPKPAAKVSPFGGGGGPGGFLAELEARQKAQQQKLQGQQ